MGLEALARVGVADVTPPLDGVGVVDLSGLPGAYGTKLLADLGADVVIVEQPGGDPLRRLPPLVDGTSLTFEYLASGKRSVVLDIIGSEIDRQRFDHLVASADVVFDSSAPGQLDALTIGPRSMLARHPELVWVALSPFGQSGPKRGWRGSDMLFWAASGILLACGFPDRRPVVPGGKSWLGYHLASTYAAGGALLALRAKRRSGRGQLVDVSLQECGIVTASEIGVPTFLDDLVVRSREGFRRSSSRPFGLYPCKDGWVSIVIITLEMFRDHARWIADETGVDTLQNPAFENRQIRIEAAELIDALTEELCRPRTKAELVAEGQRRRVAITPCNTVADLWIDPQLEASEYWRTLAHPALGPLRVPGPPYDLSRTPASPRLAPRLGEHHGMVFGTV
jgi:crotonobetainyl-CoA:carnitine CoA-transferase CaiB-like acyl-CoA transferase